MEKTIEIRRKKKTAATIFATILLLAIGGAAIWALTAFVFPQLTGFLKLKIAAIVIIAALVLWAVYLLIQQAANTKPGLVIDGSGIIDQSNVVSVGRVSWSDITAIREAANEFKQRLIVVMVKNPDEYVRKTAKMQASRQAQLIQFGSPIVISAANLDYDTAELVALLRGKIRAAQ